MTATRPGLAVWLTGPPAAGKTTLARRLEGRLAERGFAVEVLDADELRRVLTPEPKYTDEERDWFYGVLVFLAELLTRHGVLVLIAATGHRRAYRDAARRRLARFAEVYVRAPAEVCRARDPKGLYRRAAEGAVATLPGVQVPYEEPVAPEAVVDTDRLDPDEAAEAVLRGLEARALL